MFSLCIFLGLFFHWLIYAWGQLKLREHFGAAQGACISAGMQRTLAHKVEEMGNNMCLMPHLHVCLFVFWGAECFMLGCH